ncbi:coat protein [Prunus mume chlorotic leaf curl-associated virus]|uniref:Capsid protein n=1 Tax=Prunus mume chlorotic leaf curl-associated virus TaxID=3035954 RepID=A0A9Y1PV44_9VIRU|nr:coat protein [Prunus mume chlorotic leaf curl-associated virus]
MTSSQETSVVATSSPPAIVHETEEKETSPPVAPRSTTSSPIRSPRIAERTSSQLFAPISNLGTLSSTATTMIGSSTSKPADARFNEWTEKLKQKEMADAELEEGENFGGFSIKQPSGIVAPHGVSPSTMVYQPKQADVQTSSPAGLSLGSRQRMVFEQARKRAQADIQADRESLAPPFASGDPFSRPKVQDVRRFSYEPCSPDIATAESIEHIRADLVRAGVPEATLTFAMWDIARYCADAGSSESTEFGGTSSYGGRVTRMEISSVIKKHTTLRRYCGFYAKIIWNIMLSTNMPPSGWLKKGYKENSKFAAFDFFAHVSNNAALEPENGLVRKPTHEELVAYQANKGIALHRTESAQDKNASTTHEVTGGRAGPRSRLTLKGREMD